MTRTQCYIGKSDMELDFYNGSLADIRMYNSVLSQTDITNIYTQFSKSPYSNNILDKGFNELYNPIFCNFLPTDKNNFNTCVDCNYGSGMNVVNQQTIQTGQNGCEEKCKNNVECTSYSFNTNNGNCQQYSSFPKNIYPGQKGINSGYSLNFKFDYNNLDPNQQEIVKKKCALQYVNDIYTPKKEIDLEPCLNIQDANSTNVDLNFNPKCVYDIYTKNGVPTNFNFNKKINVNDPFLTEAISDPILDNYEKKYNSYIQDKVQLSNINNVMSMVDGNYDSKYINDVQNNNDILGKKFINTINNEMNPLINLSKQITEKIDIINNLDEINELSEKFENQNNNLIGNNFLKLTIFLVIIFLIFITIYNLCN
jgi:hypothetical protein